MFTFTHFIITHVDRYLFYLVPMLSILFYDSRKKFTDIKGHSSEILIKELVGDRLSNDE